MQKAWASACFAIARTSVSLSNQLLPAAKRRAVDADRIACQTVFDPEEWQSFADILHDYMRSQRRRRDAAGKHFGMHRRGDHIRVAFGVGRLVTHAGNDNTALGGAPMCDRASLFERMPRALARFYELIEVWVGHLNALFRKGQLSQITPTASLGSCFRRRDHQYNVEAAKSRSSQYLAALNPLDFHSATRAAHFVSFDMTGSLCRCERQRYTRL